jgi:alpha-beta hydrolase superfamily lysophospholipase
MTKKRNWWKTVGFTLLTIIITVFAMFAYLGHSASKSYSLQPWHKVPKWEDNLIQGKTDFATYLADEERLIDNIYAEVEVSEATSYNKYDKDNASSPYRGGQNLNASFEMLPKDGKIVGGILLVHGLTDSPYHMRAIGQLFADQGYYVIGLRLPGHGTIPGALLNVHWKDWYEAVDFGAKMVQQKIAGLSEKRFYVGGFSTGGALTLRYVLQGLKDNADIVPDKLLLFSPAIGLSWLAEVTDWHQVTSWMYEEFKWLDVRPEYDPFKYNSFAKNAADQIYDLTKANWALVDELVDKADALDRMPPIYAYQSCVDATVETSELLDLFVQIAPQESELMLFDVNRKFEAAMPASLSSENIVDYEHIGKSKAAVVMVTNRSQEGASGYEDTIRIRPLTEAGEATAMQMEQEEALSQLAWPANVFALSHVCMPIAPEDYFYGDRSKLGRLNAKGENNVLVLGNDLHRLRNNPFYDLIEYSILESFIGR